MSNEQCKFQVRPKPSTSESSSNTVEELTEDQQCCHTPEDKMAETSHSSRTSRKTGKVDCSKQHRAGEEGGGQRRKGEGCNRRSKEQSKDKRLYEGPRFHDKKEERMSERNGRKRISATRDEKCKETMDAHTRRGRKHTERTLNGRPLGSPVTRLSCEEKHCHQGDSKFSVSTEGQCGVVVAAALEHLKVCDSAEKASRVSGGTSPASKGKFRRKERTGRKEVHSQEGRLEARQNSEHQLLNETSQY